MTGDSGAGSHARTARADALAARAMGQSTRTASTMTMNFPLILFLATRRSPARVALADRLFLARSRAAGRARAVVDRVSEELLPGAADRLPAAARSWRSRSRSPRRRCGRRSTSGDFILVNKFAYGLRLPILEQKIVPIADPQRGDVVVFRYPAQPVAGLHQARDRLPGRHRRLQEQAVDGQRQALDAATDRHVQLPRRAAVRDDGSILGGRAETTGARRTTPSPSTRMLPAVSPGQVRPFAGRDNCDYNPDGSGFTLQGSGRALLRDGRQS